MKETQKSFQEKLLDEGKKSTIISSGESISRREFFKKSGAGFFGLLLAGRVKRAAALVGDAVNRESRSGTTKISIEIFYSPHDTKEDVKGLEQKIKEADVFSVEAIGWSEQLFIDLNLVSQGELTPQDFIGKYKIGGLDKQEPFQPYQLTVLDALFGSRKFVISFDVPGDDPLLRKIDESVAALDKLEFSKDFVSCLSSRRRALENFVELQGEREQYIVKKMEAFQETLAKGETKEVRDKEKISILFLLGAVHTGVYHRLKESGREISRTFSTMPYIFGEFTTEITRRLLFGKEVSDTLVAQSLFWDLIDPWIAQGTENEPKVPSTVAQNLRTRKAVQAFSFSEIKNIFEEIKRMAEKNTMPFLLSFELQKFVLNKLGEKGFKVILPKAAFPVTGKTDDPLAIW